MELATRERSRSTLDSFQISTRVIWGLLWWFWTSLGVLGSRRYVKHSLSLGYCEFEYGVNLFIVNYGKGCAFLFVGKYIWLACSRLRLIISSKALKVISLSGFYWTLNHRELWPSCKFGHRISDFITIQFIIHVTRCYSVTIYDICTRVSGVSEYGPREYTPCLENGCFMLRAWIDLQYTTYHIVLVNWNIYS